MILFGIIGGAVIALLFFEVMKQKDDITILKNRLDVYEKGLADVMEHLLDK
jgi:hypothetical protein